MIVYVVLGSEPFMHGGSTVCGIFETKHAAEKEIVRMKEDPSERSYYSVEPWNVDS